MRSMPPNANFEDYRAAYLGRRAAARARGHERAERLAGTVAEIAARLRELGATGVWVFGSVVAGEPSPDCDLDLAVEGLPPDQFFFALAEAMRIAGTRVDLVDLAAAPASLRARIAAEGRAL